MYTEYYHQIPEGLLQAGHALYDVYNRLRRAAPPREDEENLAPRFADLNLGDAPVAPVLLDLPADELVAPLIPVLPADAQRAYAQALPVDGGDVADVVLGGGANNDPDVVRDYVRDLMGVVVARAAPAAGWDRREGGRLRGRRQPNEEARAPLIGDDLRVLPRRGCRGQR